MEIVLVTNPNYKKSYIDVAFENDFEILNVYDKGEEVNDISEVCYSVWNKVEMIAEDSVFYGVELDGGKIGYFVFQGNILFSFGVGLKWRKKDILLQFFKVILSKIGDGFTIALYSYNQRAIKWLQKMGMNIVAKEITILKF